MKRVLSLFATVALLITCNITAAFAASNPEIETYASLTLSYYYVEMFSDGKGTADIDFSVRSNKFTDEIGIDSIKIYESDGDYIKTIYGSRSNGLILTDSDWHSDSYEISLPAGSYYAKVTVFATIGSITDSRTVTTSTVRIS